MRILSKFEVCLTILAAIVYSTVGQDIIGCGGFVKSEVEINFSLIEVKLYTKTGSLRYQTDCAPNSGYYMIPVYDKGDYVLKVEPPPGWTFEPQSIELTIDGKTDRCSSGEDINFQFTGFGVVGKVVSKGQTSGPAGITLSLKKPDSQAVIKTTATAAGGAFTFEKVLPGDYVVEGSHDTWIFEQAATEVKVGRETGSAGSAITVHGYDVTGEVRGDGEAIKGVNFLLFSENDQNMGVQGCLTTDLPSLPASAAAPLCHAVSGADGRFRFGSLPVGEYALVPFYQGEHITFDVAPARLSVSVGHDSLRLKETFQVTGFSVSGKVLNKKGGSGVAGARVFLDGQEAAVSGADGTYRLDSMKTGSYRLAAAAAGAAFDDTRVKVTPSTPQLPDLVAARFRVCGSVVISKLPAGLERLSPQRKVKVTGAKGGKVIAEVATSDEGSFCVELPPGAYAFKVELTEQESKAGLKLTPPVKDVTVVDAPIDNVVFSQFRANVKGTLHCLEACGSIELSLAATGGRGDESVIVAAILLQDQQRAAFEFNDVMPGNYRVSLLKEEWCWEEKQQELTVVDRDVTDMVFKHTGYILATSLSHSITLDFEQAGKPGNVGSFALAKGVNKFCLSEPGVYTLRPKSCHQFETDQYTYDTAKPAVLTLSAVRHLVEGRVVTADPHTDITVNIKSSVEESTALGPLKAAKVKDAYTYTFSFWAKSGESVELVPTSGLLLFYPPTAAALIKGDACPGEVAVFDARPGVFIAGRVQPALAGVKVTISAQGRAKVISVDTDDSGSYKVGPLHADQQYTVEAEREGYVMTAIEGKHGHFKAFKLGEIVVQVSDEHGEKLSGVLLSLSGGPGNYRSNQLSREEDGGVTFLGLSPGQYFLRPMMKEYSFSPASQMIDVLEGSTVRLTITGTRVAFSAFGSVTSLNGEPEPGVYVEARGAGGCAQHQEEGKTEQDGSFRIRGLQPKCEYSVFVRSGDVNQHIERTAPKLRTVQVEAADLRDLNMIAFRRMNQMDLSGNVITPHQHLPHLKVVLLRERQPDSAIHSHKLDTTSFFHLPSLTIDNQSYILRLESTLSRATFTYTLPEVTFNANATYSHFTLRFDPKPKSVEQELSPGSFLIVPLTLLVVLLTYHNKQVVPVLRGLASQLQAVVTGSAAGGQQQQQAGAGGRGSGSRGSTPPLAGVYATAQLSPDLHMPPAAAGQKAKVRKA